MSEVARLLTVVDIDDSAPAARDPEAHLVDGPPAEGAEPGQAPPTSREVIDDPREMFFSALHQAVLRDGRRLTLLDDRGWGVHGPSDIWQRASVEEIEAVARTVVGPDEPYGSHSQADTESDHWSTLADILRQQGVQIDAEELSRLPHDVELTERLRDRIARA
jgi:hypothetical protein